MYAFSACTEIDCNQEDRCHTTNGARKIDQSDLELDCHIDSATEMVDAASKQATKQPQSLLSSHCESEKDHSICPSHNSGMYTVQFNNYILHSISL